MADLDITFGPPAKAKPEEEDLPLMVEQEDGSSYGARLPVVPVAAPTVREDRQAQLNRAQVVAEALPAPDEAAKIRRESQARGFPFGAAVADPEGVRAFPKMWDEYADNIPLSELLLDPNKAVLAKDELDRLVLVTDVLKDPFPTSRFGLNLESGFLGMRRSRLYFSKAMNGGALSPADAVELSTVEERLKLLPGARTFGGQVWEGAVQQLPRFGRMALVGGGAAVGGALVGSAAGPGGSAAFASAAAGTAVAADSVVEAIGDSYAEFTTEWGMGHDLAFPLSLLSGVVVGGLDALSAGVLSKFPALSVLKKLPAIDPLKLRPALQAAMKDSRFVRALTAMARDAGTEGGTETVQEAWQLLVGYAGAASAPGQFRTPTLEEASARVLVAGTTGAVVGGPVGGVGTLAREMAERAGVAEATKDSVDRLYEATDGLKVAERAPDVVKEFGDRVGEEGPVRRVTVLMQALEPVLEENKKDVRLQEWLSKPETARMLDLARRTGGRATMTLGDFLAYVRPLDKAGKLKAEIGLNDEVSIREARELAPAVKKAREEMRTLAARREFVEGQPESMVAQDVEKKLRALNVRADDARAQAELVAAGISTLARRAGRDPWETYRGAPLSVTRAAGPALARTLEQADPREVVLAPDTEGNIAYQHPESPLRLWTSDNSFEFVPAPKETLLVNIQGFDRGVAPETKENIEKFGQQGYSTALYLRALMDAQARGVGVASDRTRTPATKRMYDRLRRIGVPFKLTDIPSATVADDFEYISAEDLAKVDLGAAWDRLIAERPRADNGTFASVTQEEIDVLVAGLQELRQGDGKAVRGRITFDPVKRDWFEVTLTGKADLSTFLHESSHYLLEVMRKLVLEQPGTDLDADLRALEEWAGVAPGGEWSTEALEKFARGMETYFGEGRAPSARLASIFATFKQWILHVYRTLAGLNAPLTDEVRSVMDRMLATQEEIDARRLELGYFPSEVSLRDGDMTPEQQAQYRAMYERGAERAQAELDRAAVAGLRKEKTEEFQRISAEVEKELDTHPALSLRSYLDGQGRTDGGLVPDVPMHGKLDAEVVEAMRLGPGLGPKVRRYTGGEVDPEVLAPYFGFKSGEEMVLSLAETPARQTLKADLVRARMREKYPAYGDPAWVEKTALERLHGEDSIANAIELELATLHRKLSEVPPRNPAAVARLAAQQAVREMARRDMSTSHWRDAERRALREQMEAWAAKDYRTAADAARRRLYSRAMWDAVSKAIRQVDAAERYVAKYASPDALARLGRSSSVEIEGERLGSLLRDAAAALVEGVGFRVKSDVPALEATLRKLEAAGLPVAVDPEIRLGALGPWDGLPLERALMVRDAVRNVAHLAREANDIRVGEEKLKLDAVADEVEKALAGSKLLGRLGERGEKDSRLRALRAQIAKPETIILDIDGGKPGIAHRVWFGTAEAGQFERDRRFRQHRAQIRELSKKHRPADWSRQVRAKHKFVDGRTYTGEEVFTMLLYLGTESGRRKLVLGMERAGRTGWTLDSVVKFVHQVFPDQATYDYAQAVLDYISQSNMWEDSARVSEAITGTRPQKVEAVSIPTPGGGEIAGGYYPLVYDRRVPLTDVEVERRDGLAAMDDANFASLYASHGFTEARTGYVAPLLLNPRALSAHIYEVDHFISNAPGILARHKFLTHPRIKAAIVHSLGYDYWDQLRHSNNYIAADGRMLTRELLQVSKVVDKLVYHNALLVMGGNVLSGVNQVVNGVPATLAHLGPRGLPAFARALVEFVRSPFKTWQEVSDLSGEIEGMEFHYDRDLRLIVAQELSASKWETIQSRIAATTMAPVVFGQKLVNVITWKAAHAIALREGRIGEEAVRYANSVVRQSQSTSGPKDFAAVQRSKDGLMRVLTSLASYTFTLNDMVMPRRLTARELAGATSRLVMLILTSMVAKALFDLLFPKLEEKESERRRGVEKLAEEAEVPGLLYAAESMMDVLYNVPVVGRMGQAVVSGREARYASWVDSGIRALRSAPDAFSEKGLSESAQRAVVETVGLAAGLPTRHILFAPYEFMSEFLEGNIDDSPWAFFQELALARPGQKGD